MAKNRSMEAKRVKYIRQSRARPRTLRMNNGQMKTSQSVDRSKIPEEYLGLFAYRERAKSFIDGYLEAIYPSANQESLVRQVALYDSKLEEKDRFIYTKLEDTRFIKVCMVTTSRMNCIYFIEYHVLPKLIKQSVTYNDYDRALKCFQLKTIRWKEKIYIANVEPLKFEDLKSLEAPSP